MRETFEKYNKIIKIKTKLLSINIGIFHVPFDISTRISCSIIWHYSTHSQTMFIDRTKKNNLYQWLIKSFWLPLLFKAKEHAWYSPPRTAGIHVLYIYNTGKILNLVVIQFLFPITSFICAYIINFLKNNTQCYMY